MQPWMCEVPLQQPRPRNNWRNSRDYRRAGQCNDRYSLAVIAQVLAQAMGVGINELPASYNIAWYEQNAMLDPITPLSLGVKNIMLGLKLPVSLPRRCSM